jgi:uncharacterized protein VirK/YbjX
MLSYAKSLLINLDWDVDALRRRMAQIFILLVNPVQVFKSVFLFCGAGYGSVTLRNPKLPAPIFSGPYLFKGLSASSGLRATYEHYRLLLGRIEAGSLSHLMLSSIEIWSCDVGGRFYRMALGFEQLRRDEGELSLIFYSGDTAIWTLSFTFLPGSLVGSHHEFVALISRTQGAKSHFSEIELATKDLSDIVPNTVCFTCLLAVCAAIKIAGVAIVSSGIQISSKSIPNEFETAYDEFAVKIGAERNQAGFFMVDLPYLEAPLQNSRQKHRSRKIKKRRFKEVIFQEALNRLLPHARDAV